MNTKILLAAVAALGVASSAYAQTTGSIDSSSGREGWASDEERLFFDEHDQLLGPFFFDESFTEIRSPEEMRTAWVAMSPEEQTQLRTNCGDVIANPAAYSQQTVDLCNQLSGM